MAIEYRWAEGRYDRLPELATDLVRRRVSVIATPGTTVAALAAKAATTTIPIVFGANSDPVGLGLVASLSRPGGNATGVNFFSNELVSKRMQLLRELVPSAKRIAVLVNPIDRSNDPALRDVESAAIGQQVLASRLPPSARSTQPLSAWSARKSMRFLSLGTRSSTLGASSSPCWQHATQFRRPIHKAVLSKPAG